MRQKNWYCVNMRQPWLDAEQPSVYGISKITGLSKNTIKRYFGAHGYFVRNVPASVVTLAEYFGVNWKDYVCEVKFDATVDDPNAEFDIEDEEVPYPVITEQVVINTPIS